MQSFLLRIIRSIETLPFSLPLWCVTFLSLILIRLSIESALGFFHPQSLTFLFFEFAHTFLFFAVSFFALLPVIRYAGAPSLESAAHLLLFGFLIILTPPVIDTLIFQDHAFWSFYEFDGLRGLAIRFFTLFGDTPDVGITYGVRIEVVLVTLGIGLYAFLKSRRLGHAFLSALLTYSILFLLGTFPSYLTLLTQAFSKGLFAISSTDIAGLFLTPAKLFSRTAPDIRSALNTKMSLWYACILIALLAQFLFIHFRPIFWALWRNARLPQLIYHGGLLCVGGLLAWHFTSPEITWDSFHFLSVLLLIASVECAWLASVIVNDCFDIRIDQKTNTGRPLITGTIKHGTFATLGWFFFFGSLFFSALISFSVSLLLLIYQALAWMYSAPPLRLKRIPGIATLVAAAAGVIILLSGYITITPRNDFSTFPSLLLLFLFIAYATALPLKDFKDIEGDQSDGVLTFPVLLGEERARIVFGSIFFLLFTASTFILHLPLVFLPALFFGSISFFVLQAARQKHRWISYRRLPGIMISIIALYGLVLLWAIF
jgi:4-hydroxybenzoate polyprenyltransferase